MYKILFEALNEPTNEDMYKELNDKYKNDLFFDTYLTLEEAENSIKEVLKNEYSYYKEYLSFTIIKIYE